ncbi:MAG: hypothetical protein HYS04_14395 [Acidobacteria bacterium]|nr:hypothetical protein [Acidobacteriota bacterium]
MTESMNRIWGLTLQRIDSYIALFLPPFLVALAIVFVTWLLARTARWLLVRTSHGGRFDSFLRESGIANLLHRPLHWRSARLVADVAYAAIWVAGGLLALSVFDSSATGAMVGTALSLLPKLVIAALLLVFGAWLAQFLARSILIWAVNENVARPRYWALGVRILVFSLSVVVAAETLDFARYAIIGTYLILLAGAVVSLSLGLGYRLRNAGSDGPRAEEREREQSLWHHL